MPTKYDVFAQIIEHSPCKAKDLPFKTPIYRHIASLIEDGLIKKTDGKYTPTNNKKSIAIFKIIKYSLRNGLDYNLILSKNIFLVLHELFKHAPKLRPKKLQSNKENTELMKYLEENQFVLLVSKKPRQGIILKHQLFNYIFELYDEQNIVCTSKYFNLKNDVLSIVANPINPFDDKIFQFLSGSAQLEGSTVTAGETRDLILNDIYPEKPKKDIQMVKNLNEAMHYIFEHLEENITPEHIKEINRRVLFSLHRNAGNYKITQNKIQGNPAFKTASPKDVSRLMDAYCQRLQIKTKEECLEKLGYVHNELQYIHPFTDGNSRTTRTVLNWILLKYQIPLLVFKMGCFDEYMSLTKLSSNRDDKKLTGLFHHLLMHENLIK